MKEYFLPIDSSKMRIRNLFTVDMENEEELQLSESEIDSIIELFCDTVLKDNFSQVSLIYFWLSCRDISSMAGHLLKVATKHLPSRYVASRIFIPSVAYHKERIGNREVVGFGLNGEPSYIDRTDFPMPAIRFKENSQEIITLREKEKDDWRKLTMDEKKALYRASFCQTFAEMKAPTGEWKSVLAVYQPMPESFSPERKAAQFQRMIDLRINPIEGLTSNYDYENNRWKD
ncbi:uncharacterized protein LOC106462058 isoform X2 [Limulus polyphemus]|uniref:Cytochrome c oxidase subunit 4 n=1 Tax=Limulus polyphemus TaxID=6850 RepID=A0ABM1SMN4_LIMPO|nr:uncharacterized protein LOC106462058 isoform X2 [Limulus polyphemus]